LRFRIEQEETKRRIEENIQKIIKMAEDAGIQPAPEEYEKQKYTGKWNTLKNIWANNNGDFELPELKK
jgi:hypothetical protein